MKRIHIVGPPRTGTTLLLEMMRCGFDIDGAAPKEMPIWMLPPKPARVLLTKFPGDHIAVGPLLEKDPEQWFIYLLRDPRDMVVSRHGREPNRYWGNIGQWRSAWLSVEAHQAHPRLIIVRYEDLVRRPDALQQELAARLDFLKVTAPFSEYHQTSRPSQESVLAMRQLRPVSDESIGVWRQHKGRIVEQIARHGSICGDLIEHGYESDESWLAELAGISRNDEAGVWPDDAAYQRTEMRRKELLTKLPAYLAARRRLDADQ